MTDRPIIFSAPMVLALLESRKIMTRRLAWQAGSKEPSLRQMYGKPTPWQRVKPGDRLWVRECWALNGGFVDMKGAGGYHDPERITRENRFYRASVDGYDESVQRWRSSIHMPRWASRITLTVTATKIERLRNITVADARAEGFAPLADGGDEWHAFLDYWNKLHGDGATDANPEVVALTFTVARGNIDRAVAA